MAQQTSNVEINIGSKLDAKGFKQAETALDKMGSSAKKLAAAFGVTFAAKQIVAFSKAAMKAAADDQKSQALLANSLNNLGLAYSKVDVESFISKLEAQTAIADDVLRPSFAQLAQVTGSVAKSQELLQLAFDTSAGSGVDFASTVDILSQAYVGNYKGLKQLNLGLTNAELATMTFAELQKKLQATFSGSGATSLETYKGQMDKLTIATGNASEKIGYALLDAIIKVSGSKNVDGLIDKINSLASAFASVVTQVGNAVAALTGNETQKALSPGFMISGGRAGTFTSPSTGAGNLALTGGSNMDTQRFVIEQQKKAEEAAIKRQKELAAIEKARLANQQKMIEAAKKVKLEAEKKLVLDKASAFLTQAQRIFDMDRIELAAAAMNKQTEEDRVRIRLKTEILDLEDAINSGNVEAAARLANSITSDAQLLGQLRGDMIKLGDVPDPFAQWLQTLLAIAAQLALLAQIPVTSTMLGGFVPGTTPGQTGIPGMGGIASPGFGMGGWTQAIPPSYSPGDIPGLSGSRGFSFASSPNVVINIDPAVSGLINVIQDQSASGISPTVNRVSSSYIA
jgi:hypothetical protein